MTIDWHERQKLLKLGFELDVHADRSAAEIQFGHIFRPTHTNTSWDFARFEICAHRFLHIGEPGYGVAVSNDSTYGHDVSRAPARTAAPLRPYESPCCGRRCIQTRTPTRVGMCCGPPCGPVRTWRRQWKRATGRTCRCDTWPATIRWRRSSRSATPPS